MKPVPLKKILWFVFTPLVFQECTPVEPNTRTNLTQYVDPFIGTGGKGKTYPGATVPFGMVQLSPDNGRNGWDWISGYFYPDSVIAGFSHMHLSGTGAGDLYDLSFMPLSGNARNALLDDINPDSTTISSFSHEKEHAEPGYYRVYLDDYQIAAELTTTTRTGLQRYTFSDHRQARIKLDLGYSRNWDRTTDSHLEVINDSTVAGYRKSSGWARDQRVYFYTIFSRPVSETAMLSSGRSVVDQRITGTDLEAIFYFDIADGDQILVKTGISPVSVENARYNLEKELPGFDFEKTRQEANDDWEMQLSKVKIQTDEDNKVQFYTALYHSMLAPVIFSDVNGEFRGADGETYQGDYQRYSLFSLWDTFRAQHPLITILHRDRVSDMINSMLDHYHEYGRLPVWEFHGNETDMMLGYHAVPVIADAILKGIDGFDTELAFEAMKATAMQDGFQVDAYRKFGYVPHELTSWSVSKTMEYAFDDWCIAQVAGKLGFREEFEYFEKRAYNYRNHFDPQTSFMRAKDSLGYFKVPFDPLAYKPEDYTEANAWQYHWYAPQDVGGLVSLMGGEKTFEMKLDSMFEVAQIDGESPEWISGYIGQYVHGNEPSHHVPYLYQFIDQPAKTEYWVRRIMDDLYTTDSSGLCGNEDCGQMSAWYIFSALGFYPVNPSDQRYILGSPQVSEAIIALEGGKTFKINTRNQAPENIYVQRVLLNGEELQDPFITHDQVMMGGELLFELSNKPKEVK